MSLRLIFDSVPDGVDGAVVPIYADAFVDTRGVVRDACGFTGSAGVVVVARDQGWLCTDSRYRVQASREVDTQKFSITETTPEKVFAKNDVVVLDYRCVTQHVKEQWDARVAACGARLEHANIARGVPALSGGVHPYAVSDALFSENIARLRGLLQDAHQGLVCSGEETLSWLMNVRCPQRPFTPSCAVRALFVSPKKVVACVDKAILSEIKKLVPEDVHVVESDAFCRIADDRDVATWLCDKSTITAYDAQELPQERIVWKRNPCAVWKACKGARGLQGMQDAHRHEGAGIVAFCMDVQPGMTERECVDALEKVRVRSPHYWGPSFPTISAFGANSAVVHYHPGDHSAVIQEGPWLLDAGGQYSCGTTDMTRTFFFGKASQDFKVVYTRVLQAHIALASAQFPDGATGAQLDALARSVLWRYGWDYGHSTGHGVGLSLNVHEAPPSLGVRSSSQVCGGMVVSIEPGYYQENLFGVRLENLYYVHENNGWCCFKPLTAVPFELALIERACLTAQETSWINAYHDFVRGCLEECLDEQARRALIASTEHL